MVNVSKNTVISDLDKIERSVDTNRFIIERKTYYGIRIIGEESEVRDEIIKLINRGLSNRLLTYKSIKNIFKGYDFVDFQNAVRYKEKLFNISYTEEATRELIISLVVATKRLKEGKRIEFYSQASNEYKSQKQYVTTKKCLKNIEKKYNVKFDEKELVYLTKRFKAAKTRECIAFEEYSSLDSIDKIVEKIVEDVKKYLGIDLENDIEFINGIRTHLKVALYRLNNNLEIDNPLTDQIKYRYPFIFEISRKTMAKHIDTIGGKLIDDEIAYIAMHIGAAFERNKNSSFMPNVLLVCGSGLSTSNLLKTRLNVMLPEMKYIGPVAVSEISNVLKSYCIDFIISTTPLPISNIEVVVVNPLLDNSDISTIKTLIFKNTTKKQLIHFSDVEKVDTDKEKYYLKDLFKKENVLLKYNCKDWRQAIRVASKSLLENEYITKNYVEAMIRAVEELGPYMVIIPGIALTHASSQDGVIKENMSLCTLEEPIKFGDNGDEYVKIIVVLANKNTESYIENLLKLIRILEKESNIEKINNADKYEDIMYLSN